MSVVIVTGWGLIPAYAGKTCRVRRVVGCGEGSSPRMRGKQPKWVGMYIDHRLIPAYAGKTTYVHPQRWPVRAHPRVCGENASISWYAVMPAGSSPRMRGKRFTDSDGVICSGLIPAYAGKTTNRTIATKNNRAHPRVCGENTAYGPKKGPEWGSSPRMRGKRKRQASESHPLGLIPAYAGKTG